jgi:hypothetical protein
MSLKAENLEDMMALAGNIGIEGGLLNAVRE